jgi:calcyclin binding protein
MDMMKKMYTDGDDEMKRTIAKAWTETQDKKGKNAPPMDF